MMLQVNSMSAGHPEAHSLDAERNLTWSPAEKGIARKAFDRALKRELDVVIAETKNRAAKIQRASQVWELERHLTKRRDEIDQQFDYRYSVLIQVFGALLHRGKLNEEDLQGLSEDKLTAIRRYASFLASPIP